MKASHKGFMYLGTAFGLGVLSTHVDWTSKFVIVFCLGVGVTLLVVASAAIADARKDGGGRGR